MGWRGKGTFYQWPGRGPFSHLPPWQRPGWLHGPGACLSIYAPRFIPSYRSNFPRATDQIKDLEVYKEELETELTQIKEEIERLKKETETETEKESK